MEPLKRLAVFASGAGSNLKVLLDRAAQGDLGGAEVALVVSDRPKAGCLEFARRSSIPICSLKPAEFPDKSSYETAIVEQLNFHSIDGIVLAGYMRLCGSVLLREYGGRIVNLHPSLLPAFAGKHAIEQAIESGSRFTGVTVHFVDEGMDTGPIIAQQVVPIGTDESAASLSTRIREAEHRLLPTIVEHWAKGNIWLEGSRVCAVNTVPIHGINAVGAIEPIAVSSNRLKEEID